MTVLVMLSVPVPLVRATPPPVVPAAVVELLLTVQLSSDKLPVKLANTIPPPEPPIVLSVIVQFCIESGPLAVPKKYRPPPMELDVLPPVLSQIVELVMVN